MKNIYLIRHGQTAANKIFRFQGHADNPLNQEGLEQAAQLGEYLQNLPLSAIYASDLTRAVQTATPLAKVHKLPITTVPALREINFGQWEGKTYEEIKALWPQEIEEFFRKPSSVQIVGGESFSTVQQRAWQALTEIIATQAEDTNIAIVSHGGTIRTLVCAVLHLELNYLWKINVNNVGVSCLKQWENNLAVQYLNNDSYLQL
ncbi:MAG: alpha-ribazole phosphatase [Acidaminococcaceae bacterium]